MGGDIIYKATAKKKGAVQIVIVAIMCAVMVLLSTGVAWGLAFAERNKRTGEPVNGAGVSCGGVPDGGSDFLHEDIITTTFGGCGENGGCADPSDNCHGSGEISTGCDAPTKMYAALPLASIPAKCNGNLQNCARIQVINPKTNVSLVLAVVDTGPMNINDSDYVLGQAVPKAQRGIIDNEKNKGFSGQIRPGLDISPEAGRILGEGNLNWRFTDLALSDNSATGCATSTINTGSKKSNKVCVDAGHSNGYNAVGSFSEGSNNLVIAKKVEAAIKEAGYDVFMTRTTPNFHAKEAQRKIDVITSGCGISISIHSNSDGGSGVQTYKCNTKYQLRWDVEPEQENYQPAYKPFIKQETKDKYGRPAIQYQIGPDGSALAESLHGLVAAAFGGDGGIHLDTEGGVVGARMALPGGPSELNLPAGTGKALNIYSSGLGMACRVDVPAVILEIGFHDNAGDRAKLENPAVQDKVAKAIAAGVKNYLK